MKTIELEYGRCINLWLNELPPADYPTQRKLSFTCKGTDTDSTLFFHSAAVEYFAILGPRISYGLMGAKLMPSSTAELTIEICTEIASGSAFRSALANGKLELLMGLPEEYAQAAMHGIRDSLLSFGKIRRGIFQSSCAAHSLTGSSSRVFERLGRSLALVLIEQIMDEELLHKTLKGVFS